MTFFDEKISFKILFSVKSLIINKIDFKNYYYIIKILKKTYKYA